MTAAFVRVFGVVFFTIATFGPTAAAQMPGAPDRREGEGQGPFEKMLIKGAILIDGTGGPPRGPCGRRLRRRKGLPARPGC